MDLELFSHQGKILRQSDLINLLKSLGVDGTDVLYVHSGINFGILNPSLSRSQLLEAIYACFDQLAIRTLIFPTYTFSFCNHEVFDVKSSRSKMGLLSEYARTLPESLRSIDPLLSVAIPKGDRSFATDIQKESVGFMSTFDLISKVDDLKFLFFGVELGDCFTYMHYLEWVAKIQYRYNLKLTGQIKVGENTYNDEFIMFARYKNAILNDATHTFAQILRDNGRYVQKTLGASSIGLVSKAPASLKYLELLDENPNYFLVDKFNINNADLTFEFRPTLTL